MTDIRTNYCVACKEMADRIEELTTEAAENARIIGMSAEREMALRGEIERLRGALAKVTDHGDLAAVQIARAALEGTSHE